MFLFGRKVDEDLFEPLGELAADSGQFYRRTLEGFDNIKEAELLLNDYKNIIPIKDYDGLQKLSDAKHLLYGRCGDVGFVVGGDEIKKKKKKGQYTEEEIETASRKWWNYWKDYWKARGTKGAYPKDYACEITIPVKED